MLVLGCAPMASLNQSSELAEADTTCARSIDECTHQCTEHKQMVCEYLDVLYAENEPSYMAWLRERGKTANLNDSAAADLNALERSLRQVCNDGYDRACHALRRVEQAMALAEQREKRGKETRTGVRGRIAELTTRANGVKAAVHELDPNERDRADAGDAREAARQALKMLESESATADLSPAATDKRLDYVDARLKQGEVALERARARKTEEQQRRLASEQLREERQSKAAADAKHAIARNEVVERTVSCSASVEECQATCKESAAAVECMALGLMYAAGEGVGKDVPRGKRMLQAACDGGADAGCELLVGVERTIAKQAERDKAAADLPELFSQCIANRSKIEKWRIAGIAASRSNDRGGADEAAQRIQEIEPVWAGTLERIQNAIDLVTLDEEGNRDQEKYATLIRRAKACSCDVTPSGRCR